METAAGAVIDSVQEAIAVLGSLPPADCEEHNIDRLQLLEQAKRMLSAAQAESTHAFVAQREAEEISSRVPTSVRLGGIEAEVGLARGESPFVGGALTHTATALCTVLPKTLEALRAGRVSEYHTRIVAEQTNHLSDQHRRTIDGLIAHRLGKASSAQLRKLIQGHAMRLDRVAAERRAAANTKRARVTMEHGGDGCVYVNAALPAHQGLAVMDALHRRTNRAMALAAAAATDHPETNVAPVSREQVMADVFVEALTGQATATGVTAEIVVVMQDSSLFGDDDLPAWVPGHGPIPAGIMKHWLADPDAKTFLRRMYTRPTDGQLVALESRRRRFPQGLIKMLKLRDDTCATPFCNSPVEDADHRHPWANGGKTSWENATGLCKRCNQRKENRRWTYSGTPDELTVTTPTGHQYTVPTRPPISQIKHPGNDPPPVNTVIDIAFPFFKAA